MVLSLFPPIDDRISDWIESKRRDQIEHRKRLNCFTITLSREFGSEVYPRGDRSKGLRGVFATRSPVRPNPIAISELKVQAIHGNQLVVSGLDILDGTPILDIKKKIGR